jgi:hypothetical protein
MKWISRKLQFPNCLGEVDEKHVQIIPPKGSGSFFWNCEGSKSLLLLGIANTYYEYKYATLELVAFRMKEWLKTIFYENFVDDHLQLPPPRKPHNSTMDHAHVSVRD